MEFRRIFRITSFHRTYLQLLLYQNSSKLLGKIGRKMKKYKTPPAGSFHNNRYYKSLSQKQLKPRRVLKTHLNIYDGAFLRKGL